MYNNAEIKNAQIKTMLTRLMTAEQKLSEDQKMVVKAAEYLLKSGETLMPEAKQKIAGIYNSYFPNRPLPADCTSFRGLLV